MNCHRVILSALAVMPPAQDIRGVAPDDGATPSGHLSQGANRRRGGKAIAAVVLGLCGILLPVTAWSASDPAAPPGANVPTGTESIESLRRQLAAQQAINAQLRARVEALEQRLAAAGRDQGPPVGGLDANAQRPPVDAEPVTTAIEEALVSKGLVLLPPGGVRVTPSVTWSHDGTGEHHYDSYVASLRLEAGLPWDMAASLTLPYVQRDYPWGRNDGAGDLSLSLSRTLMQETERLPSLVLRLGYQHDNGGDAFAAVPIGYGFRVLSATLSAVKRIEPMALYGNVSYSHAWPETATDTDGVTSYATVFDPADLYGLGLGISLAATPDISVDAGFSFDFQGSDMVVPEDGTVRKEGFATLGYIDLSADFVLRKNLFLKLAASAGVTDDANDFTFSIALPYRF